MTCTACDATQTVGVYVYANFDTDESTLVNQANTGETLYRGSLGVENKKMKVTGSAMLLDKLELCGGSSKLSAFTVSFDVTVNSAPGKPVDGSDGKPPAFFAIANVGNVWGDYRNNALTLNKDSTDANDGYELHIQAHNWDTTPAKLNQGTGFFMKIGTEYSVKLDISLSGTKRYATLSIKEATAEAYTEYGTYETQYDYGEGSYFYFPQSGTLFDNFKVTGAFTEAPVAVVRTEDEFVAALADETITKIKLGADISFTEQKATYTIDRAITITSEVKTGANGDTPAEYYSISRVKGGFPMFTVNADLTLTNVVLDGKNVSDTTTSGGAIYAAGVSASVDINAGTVIQNFQAANGGAIYLSKIDKLTISGGELSGNQATNGGALYLHQIYGLDISEGTISGNSATNGGAFYFTNDSAHEHLLSIGSETAKEGKSVIIENNSASIAGGAIFMKDGNYGKTYTVTITGNAVLRKNSAPKGGAAYLEWTAATLHVKGGVIGCANHVATTHDCGANTASDKGGAIFSNSNLVKISGGLISGNSAATGGAVHINVTWGNAGLEMTGGTISGNKATNGNGGGISNVSNNVTVSGGTISDNSAVLGGGIYTTGTTTVSGGTVSGNTATNGGGIYTTGTFTISDGTISGNHAVPNSWNSNQQTWGAKPYNWIAASGFGGGIHVAGGTVSMTGGAIQENTAAFGGGIYIESGYAVTISGGTVSTNTAKNFACDQSLWTDTTYENKDAADAFGGGVYVKSKATLTLSDSAKIDGNHSENNAGGIYVGGTATITGATISGNTAEDAGGGIQVYQSSSFTMTNTTLDGNISKGNGGALYFNTNDNKSTATANISKCTFTKNTAKNGGAIYVRANSHGNSYPVKLMGGTTISMNSATSSGDAIYLENSNIFLENCKITENKGTTGNGAICYNGTGLVTIGATDATGTVKIHDNNGKNFGTYNVTLAGDLSADSKVVFEDNNGENGFLNLAETAAADETAGTAAVYFEPNKTTLSAIDLRGADAAYRAEMNTGKTALVWPDKEYQIYEQAGLNDQIRFSLIFAYRNASERKNISVVFNDGKEDKNINGVVKEEGVWYNVYMYPRLLTKVIIVKDGETVRKRADGKDFTLYNYLVGISEDPTYGDVAKSIIYYGSASQARFGAEGEPPADEAYLTNIDNALTAKDLTMPDHDTMKADPVYAPDREKGEPSFKSAQVYIASKISIVITIKNMTSDYVVKVGDDTKIANASGEVTLTMPLYAYELSDSKIITIVKIDPETKAETTIGTLNYGLYNFIAAQNHGGYTGANSDLLKAAYYYSEMVKALPKN